ncbi:porin [Curvivirga aplysinae]|uniref:porin n=1 Tax=Curvivirga aplysinae TaxID=2529852 RepID=UPI0012BC943C|nr:porin [Curvivirga aplysinae]MTI09317.1 porin [Curvivirga aplysinae]
MRKILMATTAVSASVFALSAQAAEAPKVSVSGAIDIQYASESSDTDGNGGTDNLGYEDANTQLIWDIDAEADNGLAYGGRIDWRPTSDSLDEIWIDLSGSFGKVVLGNDDGVSDVLPGGTDPLVGSYAYDGGFVGGENHQVGSAALAVESQFNTGDEAKISYFTPAFAGFSAGFSFTPDSSVTSTTTSANLTTGAVTSTTTDSTSYDNHYELIAAYSGEFNGIGLDLGAGYYTADAATRNVEDVESFEVGATVAVAGFTIGTGYFDDGDSLVASGSSASAGEGYNMAVGYSFGATAVSVGYLATEVDDATGTTDEYDNLHFDVEYTVAEGLAAYVGVQLTESNDGSTGTSEEGQAVVIGTSLSF